MSRGREAMGARFFRIFESAASSDGILRSEAFPGLWLDPAALVKLDSHRMLEVLRQGTASTEHAEFVQRLG